MTAPYLWTAIPFSTASSVWINSKLPYPSAVGSVISIVATVTSSVESTLVTVPVSVSGAVGAAVDLTKTTALLNGEEETVFHTLRK